MRVEMAQKVKQRRQLARSTLLVIIQILSAERAPSSRSLAQATELPARSVTQIIKRLSKAGWLAHNLPNNAPRSGQRRHPIRYRLTIVGRQEARRALEKQASRTGGKWQIHADLPARRVARAAPLPAPGSASVSPAQLLQ